MNATEGANAAKALSHPVRIEILTSVRKADAVSPIEFSRASGVTIGTVAYHLKELAKLGVVKVVRETQRRGALEHHYGPAGRFAVVSRLLDVLAKG